MTRAIYFDCFSGASGDMLLGALAGCGLSLDALAAELRSMPLGGYRLAARPVMRGAIAATKVDVLLDTHEQPHRRLADITALIDASSLPAADKDAATRVFVALGEAEAKVHGVGLDAIEFHEVGAVDSIVDIVGTVVGLRLLGIEEVYASPLPVGAGFVKTAHGTIPVPGPATLELLASAGAPVAARGADDTFELLTPTAAALLTRLARFAQPAMTLERVGYGAGGRDTPARPNALRAWIGEVAGAPGVTTQQLLMVETNIDDMNPQIYGWLLGKLFEAGALDAWLTPIQMKKNRPGVMVQALCPPNLEDAVVRTLLRETSTLGVRVRAVQRHAVQRTSSRFASSLGEVRVKVKHLPDETPRVTPEYDDCAALATSSGLPLVEVYRIVAQEAATLLDGGLLNEA